MITRRILVTVVKTAEGGTRNLYGRYDAVALASRKEKIIESEFKYFSMSEEDFIRYGKELENGNRK